MIDRFATALALLLLATCIDATSYDFNFLDNYRRPAPSPEEGPPASRNASRNKGLLPAQICAIVGAYVLTVLLWGILLLTLGRKMRRKAENPPKHLELELVTKRFETPGSPQSTKSATSWFKKGFRTKNGSASVIGSPYSPAVHSPASFDQKVIDSDRTRAQADMERLYAAVMEHDRKKSMSQSSIGESSPQTRRPLQVDTTYNAHTSPSPASPMYPIYPPGYQSNVAQEANPRGRLPQPPASPRSVISKRSMQSNGSTDTRKARFNLKNLRLGSPTRYPNSGPDDEARTPLSAGFNQPEPPTQQNSPTTPEEAYAYEQLDQPQPLPRPAPQRLGSRGDNRAPPPIITNPRSANSSPNPLPLRGYEQPSSLPLRGYEQPLKSPDLRTTVLDRRLDKLGVNTPKTGVPYTPYSPYMPFTPLTPVTPHLVTKRDRKREQKEGRRRDAGAGKMVQSPKEIFGDAY